MQEPLVTKRRTMSPVFGGLTTASAWARLKVTMVQSGAATSHVRPLPYLVMVERIQAAPVKTPTRHPLPFARTLLVGESDRLVTTSADQSMRIWDMQYGKELFQFKMREP